MKLLKDVSVLKKDILKKSKNISSNYIKKEIKSIHEKWIFFSKEIKKDYSQLYGGLNESFEKLYSFTLKHHFSKKETLRIIKQLETELDKIRIEKLKRGVEFKEDFKKKIYDLLKDKKYSQVVDYLKKAEENISKDPETSCGKSREAIEELFRVIRSEIEGKIIKRGSLGDHTSSLEKKKFITSVENQFFKSEYGFLSNKGSHANIERKEKIDALFGFKLVLLTIDYLHGLSLF